jgi:hypothetical protein
LLVVLGLWFVVDFGLIEGGNGDDGLCLIVSGVVGIESDCVNLRLKIEDGDEGLREISNVRKKEAARERKREGVDVCLVELFNWSK